MFFATPHKGGHCADLGSTAAWWARIISGNVDNDMMQVLKKGDAYPEMLKHNYRHQLGDYKIFSFYESHGMKGRMVVIVHFIRSILIPRNLRVKLTDYVR